VRGWEDGCGFGGHLGVLEGGCWFDGMEGLELVLMGLVGGVWFLMGWRCVPRERKK
jgi:hypothetical protein